MWQDIGNLLFITIIFVALPIAADVVVLCRLSHAGTKDTVAPTRTAIGFLGLAANFFAIAIFWEPFYYNVWLFNHGAHDIPADAVAGGVRSVEIALILVLSSLILGFMAPKRLRALLVFISLYVGITLILIAASVGVL
jgi:hypothetical protein